MRALALAVLALAAAATGAAALPSFPTGAEVQPTCSMCLWLTAYSAAYYSDNAGDMTATLGALEALCGELDGGELALRCNRFVAAHVSEVLVASMRNHTADEICGPTMVDACAPPASLYVQRARALLDVPDGSGRGVASSIVVDAARVRGALRDVEIELHLEHNHVSDLEVELAHGGRTARLIAHPACNVTGAYRALLTDAAEASVQAACNNPENNQAERSNLMIYPIAGWLRPAESLAAAFRGAAADGTWTLRVRDTVANPWHGTLLEWALRVRGADVRAGDAPDARRSEVRRAQAPGAQPAAAAAAAAAAYVEARDRFGNPVARDALADALRRGALRAEPACGAALPPDDDVAAADAALDGGAADAPAFDSCADPDDPKTEYDCKAAELLCVRSATALTGRSGAGNDIWGWTSPDSGDEYALVGLAHATALVRVTENGRDVCQLLGHVPTATSSSTWRDIKTYKEYALIVSEARGHGMQVVNLRHLDALRGDDADAPTRTVPKCVAPRDGDAQLCYAHYTRTGNCHNVYVDEPNARAYLVGCTASPGSCQGAHVVDLAADGGALAPTFLSCYTTRAYTHDIECRTYDGPDEPYRGRQICFASNAGRSFTIWDATGPPSDWHDVSSTTYSDLSYCHQSWLTDDWRVALMNDELGPPGRTYYCRVADLAGADCDRWFDHHESGMSSQHNNYVRGNYVYQANYNAGGAVLSVSELPDAFPLAGLLDSALGYDRGRPGFNGAWSVYPYLRNNKIVQSDIQRGLFVWRFDMPSFQLVVRERALRACAAAAASVETVLELIANADSAKNAGGARRAITLSAHGDAVASGALDASFALAADDGAAVDARRARLPPNTFLPGDRVVLRLVERRNGSASVPARPASHHVTVVAQDGASTARRSVRASFYEPLPAQLRTHFALVGAAADAPPPAAAAAVAAARIELAELGGGGGGGSGGRVVAKHAAAGAGGDAALVGITLDGASERLGRSVPVSVYYDDKELGNSPVFVDI